jgi:aromatic ring-opening dioxygenase catalytic subunit (LigB family)
LIDLLPTYFISHGGGPWPWLEGPFRRNFDVLEASLRETAHEIARPKAVLAISGHWEEPEFTVMSGAHPPMVYDYSGFPEHTYRIRYPAPGAPQVAARVRELLERAGIAAGEDPGRGFDHGTFTPLAVMYPQADVPVLQLSLKQGYDPAEHLAAGRALAALRDEDVLVLASGLSYHNLRQFGPGAKAASKAFDDWLTETLVQSSPRERVERLRQWTKAPAARQAHPQEDHLVPLMVAVGAAESEPAQVVYHQDDLMGGVSASSYRFGQSARH